MAIYINGAFFLKCPSLKNKEEKSFQIGLKFRRNCCPNVKVKKNPSKLN